MNALAPKGPLVRVRNLCKRFGETLVLGGIDLEVMSGEVICLLGSSGSGKTTLLRCINQLELFDRGAIEINAELVGGRLVDGKLQALPDAEIRRQRTQVGMVFQNFNLFPHMTVLENIILGPVKVMRLPRADAMTNARNLLAQMGLSDKESSFPFELSGGQQQRIAIIRALALNPSLILFDEPTSALDPELVDDLLKLLKGLANGGMTMIIVTHELGFACEIADRLVLLDKGRIVEQGAPATFLAGDTGGRARQFFLHHKAKITGDCL
ncbi:amino acid ABC transporter ATP-binding protein [soil metagenome]